MSGDRLLGPRALQVGFVLLIGLSVALVSLQAGAGIRFVLFAGAGGLVLGVVVTWFVVRNLREIMPDTPDMSEREW